MEWSSGENAPALGVVGRALAAPRRMAHAERLDLEARFASELRRYEPIPDRLADRVAVPTARHCLDHFALVNDGLAAVQRDEAIHDETGEAALYPLPLDLFQG